MAEVSGASVFDRLSISRPWKKPARSCASVKPKISDAWKRWSAGLSCATFGVFQSFSFQGRKVWVRSSLSTPVPASAGTDAILPPEVDQRSGARLLAGLCHLVPAGRVRQTRVEQGAPEDVDLVLVRELGLLAAQQGGQGRTEGDLRDAVYLAFDGNVGLDAGGRRPQPRVHLGEVDLPVLLQTRRGRDDLRVGSLPVVHPGLTGLVGAHPKQDGGGEMLPDVHLRFRR